MHKSFVLLAVSALQFASCGTEEATDQTPRDAKLQAVTVQAADYKYSSPASLVSGEVSISLRNAGKEPHQAQLFKMNDGVEVGQLVEEGKKAEPLRNFSSLGRYAGGPNAVDPGESQVSVAQLEAGRYAFFCQVPDAQGRAHLALGMVSELEVTQADEEAEAPSADYSSSAKEFSFELPESWQGNVAFENRGKQPHELQVIGVAQGKTPADVEAWFKAEPGTAGPPSWTTGGGVSVLEAGDTGSFEADLPTGTYFAMCFVADPAEKKSHFALGMMQKFDVK